jgi:hypothetical protein
MSGALGYCGVAWGTSGLEHFMTVNMTVFRIFDFIFYNENNLLELWFTIEWE